MVILGEMDLKEAKLVNLANILLYAPDKAHNLPTGYVRGPRIPKKLP